MSSHHNDSQDEEEDYLNFDYVPKMERANQQTEQSGEGGPAKRARTVYEVERDAKVAAILHQQEEDERKKKAEADEDAAVAQRTALGHEGATAPRGGASGAAAGYRRYNRYENVGNNESSNSNHTIDSSGTTSYAQYQNLYRQKRYANMSEEDKKRQATYRKNMFVIRNAVKEVDPVTRQVMEVTVSQDTHAAGVSQFRSTNRYARNNYNNNGSNNNNNNNNNSQYRGGNNRGGGYGGNSGRRDEQNTRDGNRRAPYTSHGNASGHGSGRGGSGFRERGARGRGYGGSSGSYKRDREH